MKITEVSDRNILEKCGLEGINYQLDPYIGCEHYCYYCYALNEEETDWTRELLVHRDFGRRLSEELDKIEPQVIYMGYKTDPYQPVERLMEQTKIAIEIMVKKGFTPSILTKSPLVVRDIEILKKSPASFVSFSLAFIEDETRKRFEYKTFSTESRLEGLKELKSAGIRTGALICPLIPYVSDFTEIADLAVPYTEVLWVYGLSVFEKSGKNFYNLETILNKYYPALKDKIEEALFDNNHIYWKRIVGEIEDFRLNRGIDIRSGIKTGASKV